MGVCFSKKRIEKEPNKKTHIEIKNERLVVKNENEIYPEQDLVVKTILKNELTEKKTNCKNSDLMTISQANNKVDHDDLHLSKNSKHSRQSKQSMKIDPLIKENYKKNNEINNTLEKLINTDSDKSEITLPNDEIFKLRFRKNEPLFNLTDFYVTSNFEYSTDYEWSQILKKSKSHTKPQLALKILNLKERKWNKENILLSDIIKDNRENMDSHIMTKYLNLRLKLSEHFNWLIWAITFYYYNLLFAEQTTPSIFTNEEFSLPSIESIEWIKGFEWKGIFIRVQTSDESKFVHEELKALKYLFFDYVQLIDTYKAQNGEVLLSNELIFPLISCAAVCSVVVVGSVCVNKYNYDMNEAGDKASRLSRLSRSNEGGQGNANAPNYYTYTFNNEGNMNTKTNVFNNLGNAVKYQAKAGVKKSSDIRDRDNLNNYLTNTQDGKSVSYKSKSNGKVRRTNTNANLSLLRYNNSNTLPNLEFTERERKINIVERERERENGNSSVNYNNNLSNIMNENNSYHSMNVSHNVNKDIDLNIYSKDDIKESILLSRIESKHLIKVIDDLNDNYYYLTNNYASEANLNFPTGPKFKFMIISALDLIPNLIKNEKEYSMIFSEDTSLISVSKPSDIVNNDYETLPRENSQNIIKSTVEKLLSLSSRDINNFEGPSFFNLNYRIFYSKVFSQNQAQNKINIMNDLTRNIFLKQINYSLLNHKLIEQIVSSEKNTEIKNIILEDKEKIKGKSILLYSLSSSVKLKYSLIKNEPDEFIENYPLNINYLNLVDKFCKILDLNLAIENLNSLKNYFHRYGINTCMSIFILAKIKNKKIADLIKLDILCKMIKKLFNFHEGVNFKLKMNLINANICMNLLKYTIENISILNDGHFEFIKEKTIHKIQRMKIFYIIMTVLQSSKSNKIFVNFFYENLNIIFFNKLLKWKLIDETIGFNLFNGEFPQFSQETLLKDFIETANSRPLMFLNAIEHHLKITIEPMVKFKASFALEQFTFYFNETLINEPEVIVESYMNIDELSYYLLTKSIFTSRTSKKYDSYRNKLGPSAAECTKAQLNANKPNNFSSKVSKETKVGTNTNSLPRGQGVDLNLGHINILHEKDKDKSISFKNNLIFPPNSLKTKINIFGQETQLERLKLPTTSPGLIFNSSSNNNLKINSNNITKINIANNRYGGDTPTNKSENLNNYQNYNEQSSSPPISKSSNNNAHPNYDEEIDLIKQRNKIFHDLSSDMDVNFPVILYKLIRLNENKKLSGKIYKYLKPNYSFYQIDVIKDWKCSLEMLLTDIISVNNSESVIIKSYIYLFIHYFYIENDYSMSKETLNKIREIMKSYEFLKFEMLSIINLIEALQVERKNYIESEEFFSKSLIFSLFMYGDPRGRGSCGNNFMLFPIWKMARLTCILENSLTNENFKEIFHCQDNIYKMSIEKKLDWNNLFIQNLKNKSPCKISRIIVNDEDTNEDNSGDKYKDYYISDKNFEFINNFKYFKFPSISDVKTSFNSYFNSENFLKFLFRNILNLTDSNNTYDQDILTKLSLNYNPVSTSAEVTDKPMPTNSSSKSTIRKDKTAIFSPFLYDFLMNKMSFKKTPPNSFLLSWGHNKHNETSHNNYDFLSLPRVCYKLKDEKISKISCGWEHNIIITNRKTCYSWGNNESGQCGIGESPIIYDPTKISLNGVVEVACGNEHSIALTENGDVYSWGKAEDGVLGYMEKDREIEYTPKKIPGLTRVTAISSGSIHNMALLDDGSVKTWGCSKGGQLGISDENLLAIKDFAGYIIDPTSVDDLKNIKISKISAGEAHSLALSLEGRVYGWGFTSNGQLGLGICEDSFEPGQGMTKCRVSQPRIINTDYLITDLQCGKTFSTLITEKCEVLVCGVNDLNQLGIEQPTSIDHIYRKEDIYLNRCSDVVTPTLIECFLNMKVKKIACGESHCLALIEDLSNEVVSIWSWGSNRFGQLGQGSEIKKSLPKPINYILGYINSEVVEIACGAYHSLCVLKNKFVNEDDESDALRFIKFYADLWKIKLND